MGLLPVLWWLTKEFIYLTSGQRSNSGEGTRLWRSQVNVNTVQVEKNMI